MPSRLIGPKNLHDQPSRESGKTLPAMRLDEFCVAIPAQSCFMGAAEKCPAPPRWRTMATGFTDQRCQRQVGSGSSLRGEVRAACGCRPLSVLALLAPERRPWEKDIPGSRLARRTWGGSRVEIQSCRQPHPARERLEPAFDGVSRAFAGDPVEGEAQLPLPHPQISIFQHLLRRTGQH